MAYGNNENVIEFLEHSDRATATFTVVRYANKMRKLAEKFPDECQIVAENKDGSIVAHFPVKWIKINNPQREISEEEKQRLTERMKSLRTQKTT